MTKPKNPDQLPSALEQLNKRCESASELGKINALIIWLCEDASQLAQFREDPGAVLTSAGISPELGEVFVAADRYAIYRAAQGTGPFENPGTIVVTIKTSTYILKRITD